MVLRCCSDHTVIAPTSCVLPSCMINFFLCCSPGLACQVLNDSFQLLDIMVAQSSLNHTNHTVVYV